MINIFKKNNNFIEKTILAALTFFKESIFADEYALKKGFLQSLDARIKVVTFLIFLIALLLTKKILIIVCLYFFCLLLAYFSKVKPGFFLKRTWIFIPIFSLFIALPALFNFFTPGEPLVVFKVFGLELIITRPGLFGAILFVTRVLTSVSFVILLALTTRHSELLRILQIFKIPVIFVLTLGMCYRYIFLFIEIVENTYRAIRSRVGTNIQSKRGQKVVTWNIANLWQRSYSMNNEVYKAMLSRGYTGEARVLNEFKVSVRDWLWLGLTAIIFGSVVCL